MGKMPSSTSSTDRLTVEFNWSSHKRKIKKKKKHEDSTPSKEVMSHNIIRK
uniref:Uncharacterized protein n=1 Tax=Anguilla anguilla TaxID=7936 RepID=A0A0E9X121_ANGAN